MERTPTRPWNAVDNLRTNEDMAAYLEAALEEGDPKLVAAVLGDIAKAKGISAIPSETGPGTENLSDALSRDRSLNLATMLKIVRALGLRLHASTANI